MKLCTDPKILDLLNSLEKEEHISCNYDYDYYEVRASQPEVLISFGGFKDEHGYGDEVTLVLGDNEISIPVYIHTPFYFVPDLDQDVQYVHVDIARGEDEVVRLLEALRSRSFCERIYALQNALEKVCKEHTEQTQNVLSKELNRFTTGW
jgi:hypothetical protein